MRIARLSLVLLVPFWLAGGCPNSSSQESGLTYTIGGGQSGAVETNETDQTGNVIAGETVDATDGSAAEGAGGQESGSQSAGSNAAEPGSSADSNGNGDPSTAPTEADEILDLVNAERAAVGAPPLARSAKLDAAAQVHAEDMYDNQFFSHTGSDGSSVSTRVERQGYTWSTVGENIAYGASTPAQVMQLWMNSSGHRANILNAGYTELGVGIDARGPKYWVQDFGRP